MPAARSYLHRIAEPLRPGDPVLFAMPQASFEEARPPAQPHGAVLPAWSAASDASAPPVLRRKALRPDVPGERPVTPAGLLPAMAPPVETAPQSAPPAVAPRAPALGRPAASPDRFVSDAGDGVFAGQDRAADAPPGRSADAPGARSVIAREGLANAAGPSAHALAADAGQLSSPAQATGAPALRAAPRVADASPRQVEPEPAAASPGVRQAARPAVPIAPATRQVAALPPAVSGAPAPPRIYIGTVEVRSAAPPPAPVPQQAAPRAAPRGLAAAEGTPLARAYAWRFGLVQG
jgi:hypothetical protein